MKVSKYQCPYCDQWYERVALIDSKTGKYARHPEEYSIPCFECATKGKHLPQESL